MPASPTTSVGSAQNAFSASQLGTPAQNVGSARNAFSASGGSAPRSTPEQEAVLQARAAGLIHPLLDTHPALASAALQTHAALTAAAANGYNGGGAPTLQAQAQRIQQQPGQAARARQLAPGSPPAGAERVEHRWQPLTHRLATMAGPIRQSGLG
jgi:hypothetical protein